MRKSLYIQEKLNLKSIATAVGGNQLGGARDIEESKRTLANNSRHCGVAHEIKEGQK